MIRLYSAILLFLLTGCALNSHNLSGDIIIPEEEASSVITAFEEGRKNRQSEYRLTVGEAYALKSLYWVQRRSPLDNSIVFGGMAAEAIFQKGDPAFWFEGVPFALITPFALVSDVLLYPKRLLDHVKVKEDEISEAMGLLTQARIHGYIEIEQSFIPYRAPVKWIDQ